MWSSQIDRAYITSIHMMHGLGTEGLTLAPHKRDGVQPKVIARTVISLAQQVAKLRTNKNQTIQNQERMEKGWENNWRKSLLT